MNAKRLLAHYERIADAPDAVARLRRFILDLAVRGKLVPQDLKDEPASELLKRIAAEKARLVKAGEIRSPKPSARINDDELPIILPKNWAWLRLHEIGVLSGGMTPSMNRADFWDGDIVWLSPKDIKTDEVSNSELKITAKGLSETRLETYRPRSLFMVARSGILKRIFPVSINRVPAAANQDMKVLVPFLDGQERYLQIMFRGLTDFILRELVKTGTTVQSLKYAEFEQQPFPLPPLAEQHRIVAKVDELMALCDRLEAVRAEREATRDRLAAASLARFKVPDPDTFQDDARFALDALPALTTRPDQIKQLRQTILNFAVCGRLVHHDPVEGEVTNDDMSEVIPFNIPKSWKWVRWASILAPDKGSFRRGPFGSSLTKSIFVPSGYKVYEQYCPINDDCSFERYYITPQKYKELESFSVKAGDFLISCSGVTLGRITQVPKVFVEGVINQALLRVRIDRKKISDPFFKMLFRSPYFQAQIFANSTGMAIPNVKGVKELKAIPIPLPPLAEQHRIVAKVDELMALCNRLEASLTTTAATRRRLLDALLAEALIPTEDREVAA
jgi:type I restriction enzyme S subunit